MSARNHPSRWASVRLDDRRRLPQTSGVYAVIKHKKIYYIGFSSNLNQRWRGKGHHRFAQADKLRDPRLHYMLLPKDQVRSVEKLLIAKHKPLWNYSKIPAPPRQASWWRNLWMVATGVLVAFILQHSVMLGLMAAVVAIALFR